jgi:hypothetical protein
MLGHAVIFHPELYLIPASGINPAKALEIERSLSACTGQVTNLCPQSTMPAIRRKAKDVKEDRIYLC